MIWKKSNELGIATAESPSRGMILVARYNPRGNVQFLNDDTDADEYKDNVKPAGMSNVLHYHNRIRPSYLNIILNATSKALENILCQARNLDSSTGQ